MELYLYVLKILLKKDFFNKYYKYLDLDFIKKNYPELLKVVLALEKAHQKATNDLSQGDLEAAFWTAYPKAEEGIYKTLLARIASTEASHELVIEYLDSLLLRQESAKLAFCLLDVSEGKGDVSKLPEALESFKRQSIAETEKQEEETDFVNDDLDSIFSATVSEPGLRWRLTSLNRALGPLRKGDFGYVYARPETGKTTFVASEATFMAGQTDKPVLWFNNEERGEKVLLRCYEAALGSTLEKLRVNPAKAKEEYYKRTKRNIKLIDNATLNKRYVERIVEQVQPSLIIFDQLDKIKGFDADRDDLVLGAIYQWARELAKKYAPVIGVSQAGGEAEGVKYLTLGHAANSKTSKQAEADWILGIGYSFLDPANVRGFSVCKNKLIGGDETIPELRHGQWEVLLEPQIARYVDTTIR